jgi:hypothetical protein
MTEQEQTYQAYLEERTKLLAEMVTEREAMIGLLVMHSNKQDPKKWGETLHRAYLMISQNTQGKEYIEWFKKLNQEIESEAKI